MASWAPDEAVVLAQSLPSWTGVDRDADARVAADQQPRSVRCLQNVLLLPLAAFGSRRAAGRSGTTDLFWAMRFSCAFGLVTMVYQAHGYGYRYLHHLLPCFCLLAAEGWVRWNDQHPEAPLRTSILGGSVAIAIGLTMPLCFWMSHAFVHPYAAAYRLAKSAPADIVLVDARNAAFVQDIVRIDDRLSRPLLLDLAEVDGDQLVTICRHQRVMVLDASQTAPWRCFRPSGERNRRSPLQAGARCWQSCTAAVRCRCDSGHIPSSRSSA